MNKVYVIKRADCWSVQSRWDACPTFHTTLKKAWRKARTKKGDIVLRKEKTS